MPLDIRRRPHSHNSGFTTIANETLRDSRLSATELGILVRLLSNAQGWTMSIEVLARYERTGIEKTRTALRNLENAGYLNRERKRRANGTFETVWIVHEIADRPF